MSGYCSVADLRPQEGPAQSGALPGTRWPEISVTTTQADDVRLQALINDAADLFDGYTGDTWRQTTYTYNAANTTLDAAGNNNYGLYVLDGNMPDARGLGGKLLDVPERIASFTNAYLLPIVGTPVLIPSVLYKVHSTIVYSNRPDEFDALEVLGGHADPGITAYHQVFSQWNWWTWARSVGLDCTVGHPSVPEDVARSSALMVMYWLGGRATPLTTQSYSSGAAHFDLNPGKNGEFPNVTGIPEVDRTIQFRGRNRFTAFFV